METSHKSWLIRNAEPNDLLAILQIYDDAVAWLNARGITEQWGTTPVSSRPHLVEQITKYIQIGFVAETESLLGFCAVDSTVRKPFVQVLSSDKAQDACYVHTLAASRSLAARGAGADLLRRAEQYTREHGKTYLHLDCWAGNPKLVSYYESIGFVRYGEHEDEEDGYREQLFEKVIR